jgi:uncharacterized protein (DUF2062 family)
MSFIRRRVVEPVLGFLRAGMTPDRLALCLALGTTIGIVPILGVSTALCAVAALALRLNQAAIQLVNYLLAPVQLLLIIPFVRLGEWLVGAPRQPLSVEAGLALIAAGVGNAVRTLWDAIVHASIAWIIVAPGLTWILFRALRPVLTRAAARIATTR